MEDVGTPLAWWPTQIQLVHFVHRRCLVIQGQRNHVTVVICGIFYGKAGQTKVAEQKRSIPVSSADAFVFQCKGVRVSYHIQAGGQSFVHHTNAICLIQNITRQHKRELIHFNRRRHYRICQISRMKTKRGFLPLTRLDTLQANKQREREKQSSDQHGVCWLARKTTEINGQLPHSVWSAI